MDFCAMIFISEKWGSEFYTRGYQKEEWVMKPGYWIGFLALLGAAVGYAFSDWVGVVLGLVVGLIAGVIVFSMKTKKAKAASK